VRSASFVLLQGVPSTISLEQVRAAILAVEGVQSLHELHIWQVCVVPPPLSSSFSSSICVPPPPFFLRFVLFNLKSVLTLPADTALRVEEHRVGARSRVTRARLHADCGEDTKGASLRAPDDSPNEEHRR
jgi:hypothetical protein